MVDASVTTYDSAVFIVDDATEVRGSLRMLLENEGLAVKCYGDGATFLQQYDAAQPGCLLLDVRMPGISGLDVQDQLAARGIHLPIIMLTGHADVQMAVRAMRRGALDFLEKPFDPKMLVDRVRTAMTLDRARRREAAHVAVLLERKGRLTPRESQVMGLVVSGLANKQVAGQLGITTKTVEAHRAQVMHKMHAGSLAKLVQFAQACSTHDRDPEMREPTAASHGA